ncbi:hypothetical protein [Hamadaea tsunoensis]|uniref:hypothetical protein n=1 Tax=Hamadaea tsunoensis TaxID=53368 RepID=UPI00041239D4|nr:hypothetical protein [Hamadaea tsunoensis]
MTETQLRAGFARIVETVVPMPDAYARLLQRRRRQRWRLFGAFAALVAAAVAVPLAIQPTAQPPRPTAWIQRFFDGPTQGGLAGDPRFLEQLTQLVLPALESSAKDVKIAYADDVDTIRLVLIVYRTYHSTVAHWLYARRGATPQQLAAVADDPRYSRPTELDPFAAPVQGLRVDFDAADGLGFEAHDVIAVAPPGCLFDVAPLPGAGGGWVPTGQGAITRRYATAAGLWRVTCDGKVRSEGPSWQLVPVSGGVPIDPAYAGGSQSRPGGSLEEQAYAMYLQSLAAFPIADPETLYSDASVAVVGAPVANVLQSGAPWNVTVYCPMGSASPAANPTGSARVDAGGVAFSLRQDWGGRDDVLTAVPCGSAKDGDRIFILADKSVRAARILTGGRPVDVPLHDGAGWATVPADQWPDAILQLDGRSGGRPLRPVETGGVPVPELSQSW